MPERECPQPRSDEPEGDLLSDWLRRTAVSTPDAPAIIEQDRTGKNQVTSFRELFEQATSLAVRFVEHGVQKQDRIALVLPKTTDAIVSVFASLLAGAVYVPIHPQWPKERIETTLADCAARLVIEGEGSPPRITDPETGQSIPWRGQDILSDISGAHSLPRADACDPALILFTSGSTGRPKGVVLSHRAVSAFVKWTAYEFQIRSTHRLPVAAQLRSFYVRHFQYGVRRRYLRAGSRAYRVDAALFGAVRARGPHHLLVFGAIDPGWHVRGGTDGAA